MLGNLFSGLPRALAWAKLAPWALLLTSLLIGAWAIWLANHDSAVIERHQTKIQQLDAPASEKAADERITDAFKNQRLRDQRDAAIAKAEALEAAKAPEARATVAPQNRALNCDRLREAGLTGGAYKEIC